MFSHAHQQLFLRTLADSFTQFYASCKRPNTQWLTSVPMIGFAGHDFILSFLTRFPGENQLDLLRDNYIFTSDTLSPINSPRLNRSESSLLTYFGLPCAFVLYQFVEGSISVVKGSTASVLRLGESVLKLLHSLLVVAARRASISTMFPLLVYARVPDSIPRAPVEGGGLHDMLSGCSSVAVYGSYFGKTVAGIISGLGLSTSYGYSSLFPIEMEPQHDHSQSNDTGKESEARAAHQNALRMGVTNQLNYLSSRSSENALSDMRLLLSRLTTKQSRVECGMIGLPVLKKYYDGALASSTGASPRQLVDFLSVRSAKRRTVSLNKRARARATSKIQLSQGLYIDSCDEPDVFFRSSDMSDVTMTDVESADTDMVYSSSQGNVLKMDTRRSYDAPRPDDIGHAEYSRNTWTEIVRTSSPRPVTDKVHSTNRQEKAPHLKDITKHIVTLCSSRETSLNTILFQRFSTDDGHNVYLSTDFVLAADMKPAREERDPKHQFFTRCSLLLSRFLPNNHPVAMYAPLDLRDTLVKKVPPIVPNAWSIFQHLPASAMEHGRAIESVTLHWYSTPQAAEAFSDGTLLTLYTLTQNRMNTFSFSALSSPVVTAYTITDVVPSATDQPASPDAHDPSTLQARKTLRLQTRLLSYFRYRACNELLFNEVLPTANKLLRRFSAVNSVSKQNIVSALLQPTLQEVLQGCTDRPFALLPPGVLCESAIKGLNVCMNFATAAIGSFSEYKADIEDAPMWLFSAVFDTPRSSEQFGETLSGAGTALRLLSMFARDCLAFIPIEAPDKHAGPHSTSTCTPFCLRTITSRIYGDGSPTAVSDRQASSKSTPLSAKKAIHVPTVDSLTELSSTRSMEGLAKKEFKSADDITLMDSTSPSSTQHSMHADDSTLGYTLIAMDNVQCPHESAIMDYVFADNYFFSMRTSTLGLDPTSVYFNDELNVLPHDSSYTSMGRAIYEIHNTRTCPQGCLLCRLADCIPLCSNAWEIHSLIEAMIRRVGTYVDESRPVPHVGSDYDLFLHNILYQKLAKINKCIEMLQITEREEDKLCRFIRLNGSHTNFSAEMGDIATPSPALPQSKSLTNIDAVPAASASSIGSLIKATVGDKLRLPRRSSILARWYRSRFAEDGSETTVESSQESDMETFITHNAYIGSATRCKAAGVDSLMTDVTNERHSGVPARTIPLLAASTRSSSASSGSDGHGDTHSLEPTLHSICETFYDRVLDIGARFTKVQSLFIVPTYDELAYESDLYMKSLDNKEGNLSYALCNLPIGQLVSSFFITYMIESSYIDVARILKESLADGSSRQFALFTSKLLHLFDEENLEKLTADFLEQRLVYILNYGGYSPFRYRDTSKDSATHCPHLCQEKLRAAVKEQLGQKATLKQEPNIYTELRYIYGLKSNVPSRYQLRHPEDVEEAKYVCLFYPYENDFIATVVWQTTRKIFSILRTTIESFLETAGNKSSAQEGVDALALTKKEVSLIDDLMCGTIGDVLQALTKPYQYILECQKALHSITTNLNYRYLIFCIMCIWLMNYALDVGLQGFEQCNEVTLYDALLAKEDIPADHSVLSRSASLFSDFDGLLNPHVAISYMPWDEPFIIHEGKRAVVSNWTVRLARHMEQTIKNIRKMPLLTLFKQEFAVATTNALSVILGLDTATARSILQKPTFVDPGVREGLFASLEEHLQPMTWDITLLTNYKCGVHKTSSRSYAQFLGPRVSGRMFVPTFRRLIAFGIVEPESFRKDEELPIVE